MSIPPTTRSGHTDLIEGLESSDVGSPDSKVLDKEAVLIKADKIITILLYKMPILRVLEKVGIKNAKSGLEITERSYEALLRVKYRIENQS